MYVAFPRSEYYGYADSLQTHPRFSGGVSTPLLPLSLTSSAGSPKFSAMDSTRPRRWRFSDNLSPHIAAPQWVRGKSGSSVPSFVQLLIDKLHRSGKRSINTFPTTDRPIRQSLETGASFPVGRNPLRVNSPYDLSAKPGLLVVCLAPHPYLSGACCSQEPSVRSCLAPTAHRLPVQATGISSHSIVKLLGARYWRYSHHTILPQTLTRTTLEYTGRPVGSVLRRALPILSRQSLLSCE
jgi:hypothetical protein